MSPAYAFYKGFKFLGGIYLSSVFDNLPEDKKKTIIDCALKEFAHKGYEQASTNNIIKEAGISKGILFHYFKTKKDLYRYIICHSIDTMYTRMLEQMDFKSTDYFERMLEGSAIKMQIQLEYPEIYVLVVNIYKSNDVDIIKEITERYMPLIGAYYKKLSDGINMTKFKEGADINRLNELITWLAEGMSNKLVKNLSDDPKDMENVRQLMEEEFMRYVDILKDGVYRG